MIEARYDKKRISLDEEACADLRHNENLADGSTRRSVEELALPTIASSSSQERLDSAPPQESLKLDLMEEEEPKKDKWLDFEDYVKSHCKGTSLEVARRLAKEGISLIQKIKKGLFQEEPHENRVVAFCWGMVFHAVNKKRPFVEGTVDIKDPEHRIFNFLFRTPSCYGRSSSHYMIRSIAVDEGRWAGCKHFGIDLDSLPAGMKTVLFGKIRSVDNLEHIYIKIEAHGSNFHFLTDPNARRNAWQPLAHTAGFIKAMSKRIFPKVFGDIGKGEYTKKEFLLMEDKQTIFSLIEQIKQQDPTIATPPEADILEWGFSIVRTFFETTMELDTIDTELKDKIRIYIEDVKRRYPKPTQKGNEVDMGDSVDEHENSDEDNLVSFSNNNNANDSE
jgi:hypothetical protein